MNKVADPGFEAVSAGTEPSGSANPAAVEAAAAADIELQPGPGVALSREIVDGADLIVMFGCGVDGFASEAPVEDWELLDAQGRPLREYNDIRDAIVKQVDELMERLAQQ